jgi:protein-tyrosine phosphatase
MMFSEDNMVRVLFVCMGNICRSPTAHGVFQKLVDDAGLSEKIYVDSAGTHAYHTSEPPDPRSCATALARGVDLNPLRARPVDSSDFVTFDYIVAMDQQNLSNLHGRCPEEHHNKLGLLLPYAPTLGEREVPDPYYGGRKGFERVFDLVDEGCRALFVAVRQAHGL